MKYAKRYLWLFYFCALVFLFAFVSILLVGDNIRCRNTLLIFCGLTCLIGLVIEHIYKKLITKELDRTFINKQQKKDFIKRVGGTNNFIFLKELQKLKNGAI